jgi:hypothetical protein
VRYFVLRAHEKYTDIPVVQNWANRIDPRNLERGKAASVTRRVLLPIAPNPHVVFTDVITKPFFLVSETVRDVIHMYDKQIAFKQIVLLDAENSFTALYGLPILERVDCLADNKIASECINPGSVTLEREKVGKRIIFRAADDLDDPIIVRLDAVESMLRREARGIGLSPVHLV